MRWLFGALAALAFAIGLVSPQAGTANVQLWVGGPTPSSGLPLGVPTTLLNAQQLDTLYEPDMHTAIVKSDACVTGGYCFWVAGVNSNPNGDGSTWCLTTTDLTTFSPCINDGSGGAAPVLQASCATRLNTPPPSCANNFDADYTGCNAVWTASNGTDLLCEYHGETRAFGVCPVSCVHNGHTPFYAEVGIARMPGGVANPLQTFTPGVAVISSNDAIPTANPTSLPNGAVEGGTIIGQGADAGNLFTVYANFPTNCCGYADAGQASTIQMARATVASDGTAGSWTKYYNGSFGVQAGLGGLGSSVLPAGGGCVQPRQPWVTYSTFHSDYLMVFLCNAGWFYSTATSLASENWTTPQQFFFPAFPEFTNGAPNAENVVFVTAGNASNMTIGQTGFAIYAQTLNWGNFSHNMTKRSFSF